VQEGNRLSDVFMNYDQGVKYLVETDPVFEELYNRLGYLPQRSSSASFSSFASTIIGQQLSGKAADTIFARLEDKVEGNLTPLSVVKLSDDDMRRIGLSAAKARYIVGIAERFLKGDLQIEQLRALNTEKLFNTLIAIPGIGPWSAYIIMLFNFGRIDVFPFGDGTLKRAFNELYSETGKSLETHVTGWQPCAGIVAMYLWSFIDNECL
jgi:DNA-3-methyladenine glycosylase II